MSENNTKSTPDNNKVSHTILIKEEKTIPPIYQEIDNDLAIDNLQNDITAADLQDLDQV